ncbi:hypothetical protein CROQUDRAFT_95216 [Cronartium quercuum f. sp. fusiforme G11]|uniref:Uncharacterized protein n=1 Tax=Cronartium quercuum f. sp. fusiforme G11 TaxID=708437 RepID=A0A9P6NHK1_9BASI|nr:hypothetical protein CROQUDRAFT_95216 [Cronartium quercuum f. sp. fusiforme G11]
MYTGGALVEGFITFSLCLAAPEDGFNIEECHPPFNKSTDSTDEKVKNSKELEIIGQKDDSRF